VTPIDTSSFTNAKPFDVAELVKALRRNGRLRTSPGQPDLDDTVIATLLEQQSVSIRELEDANKRQLSRLQEQAARGSYSEPF
jgi:hypothetical protein